MFNYPEVFSKLTYETAIITFLKKDGNIRLMLGTRNLETVSLKYGFQGASLGGHDNRCNIKNGNIAVFDLILGESRAFNIERLVDIHYIGLINNLNILDSKISEYLDYKQKYESNNDMTLNMNTFNKTEENQND